MTLFNLDKLERKTPLNYAERLSNSINIFNKHVEWLLTLAKVRLCLYQSTGLSCPSKKQVDPAGLV